MTAVPAAAFHGTPFTTSGLACLNGVLCLPTVVSWGGGYYRISVGVEGVGAPVALGTVTGRESFNPITWGPVDGFCSFAERTTYRGVDTLTNGADLLLVGRQDNCFGTIYDGGPNREIELNGHYKTWTLDVQYGVDPV